MVLDDVTVVITTIPGRADMLKRAIMSVQRQTAGPAKLIVQLDGARLGAAGCRNAGLAKVETEWTAFLDDDDEFHPWHLQALREAAEEFRADLVYPWFNVVGGFDPLGWFGTKFDPVALREANYIPVTVLVRTALIRLVGGFENHPTAGSPCEDWYCWIKLLDAGARFHHHPARTWNWYHHGANTSGDPLKW